MFYTCRGMRKSSAPKAPTHRDIIARNGGPAALGRKIDVDPNTAKAWNRLDSIPAPYWHAIAGADAATLEELAAAAASRHTKQVAA
ncbi:hypothetical protein [Sphingobium yanoikuyae]|uniref:hypothetical protein n=1 Tax=Sphingobium yanoikuyae TaxID=13690 RepID=UPI001480A551|nr:hypothetical protein [Sphingobium yanoikuyae]